MSTPVFNLSSLDGNNGFRLDGANHEESGTSVSNAGDVNGDGFDDALIGTKYSYESSYLVFGRASGFGASMNLSSLDGNNGFRFFASNIDLHDIYSSPYLVSDAGDVNGDGFDDVIIGARGSPFDRYSNPHLHDGASYVVFGRPSGFAADMDLSTLDGSNGFRLNVAGGGDVGGDVSVSSAGDVNGDGFDDVIVGVSDVDPNGIRDAGSSYVVFGKASGFDAAMNLSSVDGNNGFRLNGVAEDGDSGDSVSSAGDVNGDGFDDMIIGAPLANQSDGYYSYAGGASYVVFGKASGFGASMDLSSLDGNNGFRLDDEVGNLFSGDLVSSAGDVNGDGFDDLIIGSPNADLNGLRSGFSYVVFGRASGFSAAINLSTLDGNDGLRLVGVAESDYTGWSVSSAGDINGDGFDDLIIGAPSADSNGFSSGSSYVVFGKISGFNATIDLSSLDSSNGFRLDGETGGDFSGISVSSAGDVNNDGFDDLIIGASRADPNGTNSGSSYVVFGRSSFTDDGVIRGTPGDDILTGTSAAERFEAGDGNDQMIGRGGADEFLGEAGNDYIRVPDLNFESVDGGIGNDVLALGGSGLNLNLTDMAGKISGIETIRLFGTGDNTLTLRAADVLNLSDTTNTLRVNGNEGDRIVGLSHGWGDGGVHGDFHTYFNDAAVLLVGVNVATDFA